ncbi:Hsp70 family protein [Desulfosudis oleivorans]|uniref:Heat shock protein 70 n=1 Tax=Desulfosudis oleivorans (strain DSM 6200 / JCM 39069 / Hxd3) TaxID=96561 RepID=A8ZZ12_DESOH|nr:Hsp70 family protein [Desulfosudis oleivorans]ABW68785.1 Heat shock protein 70 [Desulfosudis oleivorans Hxd3]
MDILKTFGGPFVPAKNNLLRTLSIDLGTTNSTIAESVCVPGYPPMCKVLKITQPLENGDTVTSALVPSVVAFLEDEENSTVLVGEGAKQLRCEMDTLELVTGENFFHDTKNDMGLNKTYALAPAFLNHAHKVAGHVLSFLVEAAEQGAVAPYQVLTVTVPASFQINQRNDTLRAARMDNLHLEACDLMEEPTAALVDFLMSDQRRFSLPREGKATCLVFDFGGGTCDVSVIAVSGNGPNRPLSVSELSVSRYHRLGGGDIDAAIVHEVLIPALAEENVFDLSDLTWENKKLELEPRLLATAETLKIDLCRKIRRSIDQCEYAEVNQAMFGVTAPAITCWINNDEEGLDFSAPSLSAAQFEKLLEPFLDTDFLYARETEYRLTQSIFSPIEDALDRAGISPKEVDFCLLSGGSILIPQVRAAMESYFGKNKTGGFDDPEQIQTAVARGAAWNTIFKAVTGRPLVRPVLHDGIDLETNDGSRYPLVDPGTPLPFPSDDTWQRLDLEVPPADRLLVDQLRIRLISHTDGRHLLNEIWNLPTAACAGAGILLEYRVTAGKQFECRAFLKSSPKAVFAQAVENPLVNVVNPGATRLKIEETEEKLRLCFGGTEKNVDDYVNLARWYEELNQKEKAIHCLHTALRKKNRPSSYISNLMGIYYEDLKDHQRAEKAYLEAIKDDRDWSSPAFNLALLYRNTKRHDEALAMLDQAIEKDDEDRAPCLALKATVLNRMDRKSEANETAVQALNAFSPFPKLDNWALGWYETTARLVKDDKALAAAEAERKRRKHNPDTEPDDTTPRPVVKNNIILFQRVNAA